MAEIFPDVYDIVHPTPVSLKELATMAVTIEINKCAGNSIDAFYLSRIRKLLKIILPDLPSAIMNVIEEHVFKFKRSLEKWLHVHHDAVFRFHHDCETSIFKEFDDFVCDFNGSVHYEKTAQRMMQSDRFSELVKFKIACMYFFEEDIRRIWPSVCENSDLNEINFYLTPELCYWVSCFRNELDKIPISPENNSMDETMFDRCCGKVGNRRMVLYFWNRVPSESRMRLATEIFDSNRASFVRLILPKLDDKELVEFVNANGFELMRSLLKKDHRYDEVDEAFILPTWMYIKNVMSVDTITKLVVDMLQTEAVGTYRSHKVENWAYFCLEILHHVPRDLKLSIIRSILSNNNNVLVDSIRPGFDWRDVDFLLGILSCVTFEERNVFWRNYWHYLIRNTRCTNLQRIMAICFENEDEIAQFKENVMARSEKFRDNCISLLSGDPEFNELSEFLGFCYPDPAVETAKHFKQEVLRSVLLGEGVRISKFINRAVELNELIDDAFQNIDLAADFINQFMSLLVVQEELSSVVCGVEFNEFYPVRFIEIIVSRCSENICQQIKTRIMNDINATLVPNSVMMIYLFSKYSFISILSWCLGSNEEILKFREMCFSK